MAFCTNCGAEVNDGAKFCSSCGQAMAQTQPAVEQAAPPQYWA